MREFRNDLSALRGAFVGTLLLLFKVGDEMSVMYTCDGCKKQEPGDERPSGAAKPRVWFERWSDEEQKLMQACSRECVDTVELRRKLEGKTDQSCILPV